MHLLGVAVVDDGVDRDEPAGGRVVFACSQVGETGGGVEGASETKGGHRP